VSDAKAFAVREFMFNELFLVFLTKKFSCKVLCFVLFRGNKRPNDVFSIFPQYVKEQHETSFML
jgi:hypothetical protein